MAKDHSDSSEKRNDDSIAQAGPATDNLTESPTVEPAVPNLDQAPRQQKRAAKRATGEPKTIANDQSTRDTLGAAVTLNAEDLDDRQIQGMLIAAAVKQKLAHCIVVDSVTTMYVSSSDETRIYTVKRQERNVRGKMNVEYSCACADFAKDGRCDCKHIFAERLRRGRLLSPVKLKQLANR